MTTRGDVLAFFEGNDGAAVYHVAAKFRLSMAAAAKHVARCWLEQLVECTKDRPRGTRFRLGAHEQLEGLRFKLTERGRRRLAYYRLGERAEAGQLPLG
jgi:hypothetical protein